MYFFSSRIFFLRYKCITEVQNPPKSAYNSNESPTIYQDKKKVLSYIYLEIKDSTQCFKVSSTWASDTFYFWQVIDNECIMCLRHSFTIFKGSSGSKVLKSW